MSLEAHLIESMNDIVFAKDLNGRYIAGNSAWAHLLGKTVAELTGLTDLDLFPAELAGSLRANDQAMLALLETVKTPLRDASGTVIGLVGVCREIACPR